MRKYAKRLIGLAAAFTIAASQVQVSAFEPNSWAADAVKSATNLSIISEEYSTKSFSLPISRSDFVNVAINLYATLTAENVSTNPKNPFNDTDSPFANMAFYTGLVTERGISSLRERLPDRKCAKL